MIKIAEASKGALKAIVVLLGVLVVLSISLAVGKKIALVVSAAILALSVVALLRPLPQLWLSSRLLSFVLAFVSLSCLVGAFAGEPTNPVLEKKDQLALLRASDPKAYLEQMRIKEGATSAIYLQELKTLDPNAHAAYLKEQQEAAERDRQAELASLKAKAANRKGMAAQEQYALFVRLLELDASNASYVKEIERLRPIVDVEKQREAIAKRKAEEEAKIGPHAVIAYDQKNYPKFFAQWGADGMAKINKLMPLVARKAAASPECDLVELVEFSGQRSVPRSKMVFFVDCKNGKRFYIEEAELAVASVPKSQTAKTAAIGDAQAILACREAIRVQLTNPLTFDTKFGTTSVYRAPTTGNVVVEFLFEAKNNFGAALPHRARCVITDRGMEEAAISK